MPANPTAATVVGNKFVFEYYTTLSQKPENIATFYKAESTLTSGVASFEMNGSSDAQTSVAVGASNIAHSIMASNFKGANVVLSSISCQESLNGGVLVSVLGTIQTKTDSGMEPARAFVHVFFLGVQTEPMYSYFVLNDIFTFVNTSVSPSPKQVQHIPHPSAFSVTSAPQHHSPIPAPQPTPAPVSVVVEPPKPAPQPAPKPAPEPVKQTPAPAPTPAPTPAPAKTEAAPVVATTSSGEKQKTPKENKKSASRGSQKSESANSQNNGEFYVKGGDRKKDNKSPRTQNKKQTEAKAETGAEQSSPAPQQQQEKKQQPKRQNSNGKKNEKKAENQEKAQQQTTTTAQTNGASPSAPVKNNSWATVVAVSTDNAQPVFAPPAVVYNEAPKPVVVEEVKVEKKREEKPRKQKEPKKETPEETAMKRTRELRSVRVSNLPYEVELAAVQALFKQFGEVKEVVLKRGFAYVEFHTVTGATNVLSHVRKNDLTIEDPKGKPRTLNVEQRKPKYEAEPDKPFYMTEKIAFEAKKKQETVATTTAAPSS